MITNGKKFKFFIFLFFLSLGGTVFAQSHRLDSLLRAADSLRAAYFFDKSIDLYNQACDIEADSLKRVLIGDRRLLSENGRNMSEYVYSPTVIAKQKFSIDDFFLYYPLPDSCWHPSPVYVDSLAADRLSSVVYVENPAEAEKIYWPALDSEGIRNIYVTENRDTVWSLPVLVNESMTSDGDEIFPMLSPDGKSLYFASSGLYGVGGYDLYVSHWNDRSGDWDIPVNMGFPYSSPADDFLLINTDDGKYTVFASNRECSPDSVYVYVLEYDTMPVRSAVTSPEYLAELSRMEPLETAVPAARGQDAGGDGNAEISRYMNKIHEVGALRDSIACCVLRIDENSNELASCTDSLEQGRLASLIAEAEKSLGAYQDSLGRATDVLQQIEMDFLMSGVIIDPEQLMARADDEENDTSVSYVFEKRAMGDSLSIVMEQPKVEFDYSFKVLPVGQFALDSTLPDGIVYQIQLCCVARRMGENDLKGLSPVFEEKTPTGKYIYSAGVFSTYNDVLAKLNTVKRAGFRSAFITAFKDGEPVKVARARALEAKK